MQALEPAQIATASELCSRLFLRAGSQRVTGRFQFLLEHQGTTWALHVNARADAAPVLERGRAEADVIIRMSCQDLLEAASGTRDMMRLFAGGQIEVRGNFVLAIGLQRLFLAELAGVSPGTETAREVKQPSTVRRASERIAARLGPVHAVDRQARPDVAAFRAQFCARGIPLVITGAVDHWPLFPCSWERLRTALRGFRGFARHEDYVARAFSASREFRPVDLDGYLDQMLAGGSTERLPPYVGNNAWPDELLELIEFPPYFRREEYGSEAPRFWLGPAGTLTPLHRDGTDNLFVQVLGRKRITLASPDQWRETHAWTLDPSGRLEGCDVDPEQLDVDRLPLSADARFLEVELGPGEMLFIPEGWFHHVRALDPQLSINFWTRTLRGPHDLRRIGLDP